MLHFRGSKAREDAALGNGIVGDICVVLGGNTLDSELVYLGCQMARGAKRKVRLLHVVEVPRTHALHAAPTGEVERADALLHSAMLIAKKVGCEAIAEVVQTRNIGIAIVNEAKEHHCALILIGEVRNKKLRVQQEPEKTIPYVLTNTPCRVWFVQDIQ